MIQLKKALRLGSAPQVAFVGAGGKSTALFALARQFDKPVLVTTSTHLSAEQTQLGDEHLVISSASQIADLDLDLLQRVTFLTGPLNEEDRATSLQPDILQTLSLFARQHGLPLLIEADGARQLSLKAPAEHEPAIPPFVDTVVVVAGLSAVGKPLSKVQVHRPDRFASLAGMDLGQTLEPKHLAAVLLHPLGGMKNVPSKARRLAFLNQADTPELEGTSQGLAANLLSGFDAVLVASLQSSYDARAAYEPVAGILLAAGGSERLGKPKQLLDWKGKPFVRQVAETAIAAGLSPVIVVTGAEGQQVAAALEGLDVRIVLNKDWREGQSTSMKAGLAAIPANAGAALFMVSDQPQLPVALIEALSGEHAASLAPIVAPLVDGSRSNPVLFDRATFAELAGVQGDTGGRAIFSKYPVTWVPWLDSSLAIDVDTPEDYERLLRQFGQRSE